VDAHKLERPGDSELLVLHSQVLEELRRGGLTRTANSPVADLAERVAARALNLTLAEKSTANRRLKLPFLRLELGLAVTLLLLQHCAT